MLKRTLRVFNTTSSALLIITASAKTFSAFGNSQVLHLQDPIFAVTYQQLFLAVGVLELIVAFVCIFSNNAVLWSVAVAWLATCMGLYRIGLMWIDYRKPCHCLGMLTDALHIPPPAADTAMKIILAYLLLGSYATLFWLWRQRKTMAKTPPMSFPKNVYL